MTKIAWIYTTGYGCTMVVFSRANVCSCADAKYYAANSDDVPNLRKDNDDTDH